MTPTIYEIFYDFWTALFSSDIVTKYQIIFNFLSFISSLSLVYLIIYWFYSIIDRFIK
jgi:hypothetical protein